MMKQHHEIPSQIIKAIHTLADKSLRDDSQVVEQLVEQGFSPINAEKLLVLIPLAFGRIALKRMGVQPSSNDLVVKGIDGLSITLPLAGEHYYTSALAVAEEAFRSGIVSQEVFIAICGWSAEVNAAIKAFSENSDISGAISSTPIVISGLPAEKWQNANSS